MAATQVKHKRRGSYEFEDIPARANKVNGTEETSPIRSRVHSTPNGSTNGAVSAGPYQTTFASTSPSYRTQPFPGRLEDVPTELPVSPFRTSFSLASGGSHRKTPSMSSDTASSPFRSTFPSINPNSFDSHNPTSRRKADPLPPPTQSTGRHTRIHSRNLSIYFPQPGAPNSTPSIAEDGAQEIEAPVTQIPHSHNSHPASGRQLGGGFKFGGKPAPTSAPIDTNVQSGLRSIAMGKEGTTTVASGTTSRRGHHHRHSLSHSFFSFMEPGSSNNRSTPSPPSSATAGGSDSPTSPTAWAPVSPFPPTSASTAFPSAQLLPPKRSTTLPLDPIALPSPSTQRHMSSFQRILTLPARMQRNLLFGLIELCLGTVLFWSAGHNGGSLACVGLGYWVVFDSMGVFLSVYSDLVQNVGQQASLTQPYGSQRTEVVALFTQSIYLLFSAVYICKETLEHVLLSAGSLEANGHHHHHESTIDFPPVLLWLSLISILLSGTFVKNHHKLVDATGNLLDSPSSYLRSLTSQSKRHLQPQTFSPLKNPYSIAPSGLAVLLLLTHYLLEPQQHRAADLLLAGIETVIMFAVAYPAAGTLGQVLLQTAPERSHAQSTEGLLRAMKEIARHPQVLHLPAPHVWQLNAPSQAGLPSLSSSSKLRKEKSHDDFHGANGSRMGSRVVNKPSVIVTLELHVRKDLEDVECLELTRWAWQRCVNALGQGEEGVTVGIVRG